MRSLEPHLSRNFRCHELLQSNIFLVQLILVQHGAADERSKNQDWQLVLQAPSFMQHSLQWCCIAPGTNLGYFISLHCTYKPIYIAMLRAIVLETKNVIFIQYRI